MKKDIMNNATEELSFERKMAEMTGILSEARSRLVKELGKREIPGLKIHMKGGQGIANKYNDRTMYFWIACYYKDKEYDINLFESEIDSYSGNCHAQIGKIKFTGDYVNNKSNTTSPNEILKDENGEYLSNFDSTTLVFNSYKWKRPFDYFANKDLDRLSNKKWVTVDDVISNRNLTAEIIDAFLGFVGIEEYKEIEMKKTNVPATLKDYCIFYEFNEDETDEMLSDKMAVENYETVASLLNEFTYSDDPETMELAEDFVYGPAGCFDDLLDAYVESGNATRETADRLLDYYSNTLFDLGPEFGFLLDMILEFFSEGGCGLCE